MFCKLCDYSMEIFSFHERDWILFRLEDVSSVYPDEDVIYIRGDSGAPIPCLMSSARILIPGVDLVNHTNPHDNAESET